jgi:hypothetical protein
MKSRLENLETKMAWYQSLYLYLFIYSQQIPTRVKTTQQDVEIIMYYIPYFLARKTHFFFPEKFDLNSTCILCAEGIISKLINTRTSIIQHLYCYTRGRVKWPSITNVCEWVKNYWQQVKSETIVKSLKKMWH